jgi:signal transduction histidine kinase
LSYAETNTFKSFLSRHGYLLAVTAWFITLAIIIDTYFNTSTSPADVRQSVEKAVQKKEKDFEQMASDSVFIQSLLRGNYSREQLSEAHNKPYYFFLYEIDSLSNYSLNFWNTHAVVPTAGLMYLSGNSGFVQLQNGYYVWSKRSYDDYLLIGLIPVKWNYVITNEYITNEFALKKDILEGYVLSDELSKGLTITSIQGTPLFSIYEVYKDGIPTNHPLSIVFMVIAVLVFLLFLQMFSGLLARKYHPVTGILFFAGIAIVLRVLTYHYNIPLNTRQFNLFDPAIYGSSAVLKSLGDLLINVLLALWITLLIRNFVFRYQISITPTRKIRNWLIVFAGCIGLLAITFICTSVVRSLVADSHISFDVMNFFSLNRYSVIGVIILCSIAITFYTSSQLILHLIRPLLAGQQWLVYLLILVPGMLYLSTRIGKLEGGTDLFILLWLVLFVLLCSHPMLTLRDNKIISSRLIVWLIWFSVSITGIIILQNRSKELQNRKYYADNIAAKADPTSETLINTMLTDFRDDYLADNFYKLASPYQSKYFKDSLIEGNVSGYTDKYLTRIFTFDAEEQPLHNPDSTSYNDLNTIFETQAKPTGISNLYYYDQSYDQYSYISKKTLYQGDGQLLGYVFILASLKVDKNEVLYPELFNRGQTNSIESSSKYAFAVYNNGKLISSYNDYPFATTINTDKLPRESYFEVQRKGHHELWHNAGAGRLVVIVSENNLTIETMTLFSYIFCAFLLLTFLIWIVNALVNSRFRLKALRNYWQLSLRNQIHGTIIFISVLSFLVIGAASIVFFVNRYQNNNREMLSRVIHIMENEIKTAMNTQAASGDSSDSRTVSREQLEVVIRKISEIHGTDVNLYDLNGNLMVSSLPLPYIKGILSTLMEPVAFYHMDKNNEVQYFQQEQIGKLSFISNYKPVINNYGDKFAYLNIPYFTSESNLKAEISNFLVTIINLNAFIFLIAGIVAFYITNRITRTFSIITEKMKMINLEKENEPVVWTRDDEIGQLVKEFNTMLGKLDASAEALAKTEREGAWREMARQIAHEIKNPLTPMKLSMQYLQKAMSQNPEDVQALTNSVAKTMVEQIDHLSSIASEFNQFANIEHSNKQVLWLNEVLRSVIELFNADPTVELQYALFQEDIRIEADKSHINRIFTNLIKNAIQAVPEGRKPLIRITEVVRNQQVIVSVRDNGSGIDEALQAKIFMPNFTTKTSGTGLGLAMCKRMVEHAGGTIWFETEKDSGTIFYVSFPLVSGDVSSE